MKIMNFLTLQSSPILYCLFPPSLIYVPLMQLQVWDSAINTSPLKNVQYYEHYYKSLSFWKPLL